MALDFSDLYMIHAMDDRNNVRTRAKTIEDNFGLKTESVEQYRNAHGGFGVMKAIGIAALGIVVGAALTLTPLGPVGLLIGATGASIGASVSLGLQNEKVMKGYNSYLDQVSAQGRAIRDGRGTARGVEFDNGTAVKTNHAADIDASRQQTLATQNVR